MALPPVRQRSRPSASAQNELIRNVNALMPPNVGGAMFGSWGQGGQTVATIPVSGGGKDKWGKLDTALEGGPGETTVVSIYQLNYDEDTEVWSWDDTNSNQDPVYCPPVLLAGNQFDENTWVRISKFSDGKWYVTGAGCVIEE